MDDWTAATLPTVDGVTHSLLDVGERVVHVAEAGSGPPLVLLHGWPQHWYCWRHMVPELADSFHLVMPDMRGFGWSSAPRHGYDKEQLATDLFDLLDVMGLDQVGLVGHDWGGWVGFLACLREPDRFRGFVALGIVHPFQRPSPAKLAQAWRGAYQVVLAAPFVSRALLQASPAFVDTMVRVSMSDGLRPVEEQSHSYGAVLQQPARARASVQMYRTFLTQELPVLGRYRDRRLTVPTRMLVGEKDPVASRAMLAGWESNADDMTVEIAPGAGHFLPEEIPGQVAGLIRDTFAAPII